VTVDIGIPLVAEITQASLKDMALRSGAPVHLSFKSTSVHVY
jgi:molybdopterin-binding protein